MCAHVAMGCSWCVSVQPAGLALGGGTGQEVGPLTAPSPRPLAALSQAGPRAHRHGIRETQARLGGKSVFNSGRDRGGAAKRAEGWGAAGHTAGSAPSSLSGRACGTHFAQEVQGPFPELCLGGLCRLGPCLHHLSVPVWAYLVAWEVGAAPALGGLGASKASPRGALWGVSPPSWVLRHGGARPDAPPPPHPHLRLPPGPTWIPRWCLLDPRPGLFLRGGALGGLGAGAGWPPDSGGPAVPSLHTDLPHTVPQSLTLLPALGLRPGPCAGPWPALSPPRTVPVGTL